MKEMKCTRVVASPAVHDPGLTDSATNIGGWMKIILHFSFEHGNSDKIIGRLFIYSLFNDILVDQS